MVMKPFPFYNGLHLLSLIIIITKIVLVQSSSQETFDYKNNDLLNFNVNKNNNETCPPCFNCMLPIFECKQYSNCNSYTGQCDCIDGFGGDDCALPLCGSLQPPIDNDKGNSANNLNRPLRNETLGKCTCDDGWGGINCNVCEQDNVCDIFMPDKSIKGTCNKNGIIVKKINQYCDVTNEKILSILKGSIPQVTFACNKLDKNCNFQFWVDQIESFYCGLDNCTFNYDLEKNTTHYECEDIKCKCIPGTFLCGKNGSIDISEFLSETIRGPGDFACELGENNCKFSEPAMNDLILTVFGDPYITLKCDSGECMHYSEIPGYVLPPDRSRFGWRSNIVLGITFLVLVTLVGISVLNISKNSPLFQNSSIRLPISGDDTGNGVSQESFLKTDSSATLSFENVSYYINNEENEFEPRKIIHKVSGLVKPGEILAIMGGSGAGKTTLLDILAKKRKTGRVSGTLKINGIDIPRNKYTKLIGFVDQDDYLLPTLTVYETVLNSALLRLPRSMSFAAKRARVFQVLDELRILDIKDRIIGNDYERGISGGEKRRVSIACELVTSPLILFLDEPTSGLDSNNANNVVECLLRLSKDYKRTLIFSIHQPRSNIFHLFDKLVLLSNGDMIYSGDAIKVNDFLRNSGYECPEGYNIADYLIDITFDLAPNLKTNNAKSRIHDAENILLQGNDSAQKNMTRSVTQGEWEHFATHRDEMRNLLQESSAPENETVNSMNSKLLCKKFRDGQFFDQLVSEIDQSDTEASTNSTSLAVPSVKKAASFGQQLSILCSRSFKNVYRDPKLLLENYGLTVLLALFLGALYYNITNDISGFQNRMGLFFFILTYFGFITFTGLSSFSFERIIFIKERSNNYYSPLAYYLSKIISDLIPLRVIPPVLLALVIYPMAGLNLRESGFLKFIIILILFNFGISLEILTIGITFKDLNNSIILSVLVLLGSLLFSGLFINTQDITNVAFKYLKNISIFYYAYEALLINEVKTLILREKKYGLNIEVPGATILSTFGFKVQNLFFDIKILALFNVVFLILGYLSLKHLVVEQK
ncbi:hypothetical protein Kpol_1050p16 [Vanderwaltozyma polyspora DSM 70294]|uniref:ABC transporter domain-containing protein n=1 Tax=Vanderwaltozyma polyspora (strain ATCC 22028 / DSM 70294 / BCRC 21397 / CBS 2163 / NBRC 10782 / NRRL Y-8283 / UCD 57-17) TaxID=436907 RepID=A7TER3_VANPO|nr:uncharacterized protein Kpol_1050p16 [Vanderwaltozyma polyspora DSM 70294]EDO19159.1 hypothetical protein Kpol_1050p16 [Vanderwaltozyma polyspora DSM 70294]